MLRNWRRMSAVKSVRHISVPRSINFNGFPFNYFHHGLLLNYEDGSEKVIHYTGDAQTLDGVVTYATVADFLKGYPRSSLVFGEQTAQAQGLKALPLDEILQRAESRLGERRYNLISNNCEHFATDCLYGKAQSKQVDFMMGLFGGLLGQSFLVNATQQQQRQEQLRQEVAVAGSGSTSSGGEDPETEGQ